MAHCRVAAAAVVAASVAAASAVAASAVAASAAAVSVVAATAVAPRRGVVVAAAKPVALADSSLHIDIWPNRRVERWSAAGTGHSAADTGAEGVRQERATAAAGNPIPRADNSADS